MPTDQASVETTIRAGRLRGKSGEVISFRGVPYASAPRFAAPRAVEPWDGVRAATEPGPAAPQASAGNGPIPDMTVGPISEDCLRAEIWTPDVDGARPILVWVPGGRYQVGSASLATYDGTRLAADGDLVVIGLNYRLGALGFLQHDDVPSNLGLRDLRAALEWIQAEAPNFGGDPSRVVVMGESAGAGAICHLLATAGIEQLISGAIIQSGAPGSTLTPATAQHVAETFLACAGGDGIDALRARPLDQILEAQVAADAELLASVGMMPFHPFVDDDLLPLAPLDAARAGSLAPVPIVIGTTTGEMELFRTAVPDLPEEFAREWLAGKLAPVLGRPPRGDEVAAGLRAAGDLVGAIADVDLHLPAVTIADTHAARGLSAWRYRFDWQAPDLGAAHATDLPFTFGTLDVADWRAFLGADARADALSAEMRQAWSSFCHTGTPTSASVGDWPPHDRDALDAVTLGADTTVDHRDRSRLRAWHEE